VKPVGLDHGAANVKTKTGEKVGPIGRQEAINCDVTVIIKRGFQESEINIA